MAKCAHLQCLKPARAKSKFCILHKDKRSRHLIRECGACNKIVSRKSFTRHSQQCAGLQKLQEAHGFATEIGKRRMTPQEALPNAKREKEQRSAPPASAKRVTSDLGVSARKKVSGEKLPEGLQQLVDELTRTSTRTNIPKFCN